MAVSKAEQRVCFTVVAVFMVLPLLATLLVEPRSDWVFLGHNGMPALARRRIRGNGPETVTET